MRTRSVLNNDRGMTLIEIIVVIVLISLVFGVVARGIFAKGDEAKARTNLIQLEKVKSSIEQYRLEFSHYPSSLKDLMTPSAEVQKSGKFFSPLIKESDLNDLFGFPIVYKTENDNRSYSLTSFGADGVRGGEGPNQDVTLRP